MICSRRTTKNGSDPQSKPSGLCAVIEVKAASISSGVLALKCLIEILLACAATSTSLISGGESGLTGFTNSATADALGLSSPRISRLLPNQRRDEKNASRVAAWPTEARDQA